MLRAATRLLLGWVFLRAGLDVLRTPEPRVATSSWLLDPVRAFLPEDVLLVQSNAAMQVGAAGLLTLGRWPRLAALLLAASMVPTTLGGHAFWRHADPTRRAQQQIHFDKNLAIIGGLLMVALERPAPSRRFRS